jgi:predicted CXXCH cytochrome family protein
MRFALLLVGLSAGIGVWTPAQAQHAQAAAPPDLNGCAMCHTSHGDAAGSSYALRVDDIPGVRTAPSSRSPGLSTVSRSCLRCHATPSLRSRQPGFEGRARSAAAGGKYLQLDLSDDHPLGRAAPSAWPQLDDKWPGRKPLKDAGLRATPGGEAASVECTTCHDPHSRNPGPPNVAQQQMLCGSCHEPARYSIKQHSSLVCSDCHLLHGGSETTLLAEPAADLLCRSCHDPGSAPGRRAGGAAPLRGPRGHVEPPRGTCTDCHAVH